MKLSVQEIAHKTEHRPWPLPDGSWKYYQEWNDVVFLHWAVDEKELAKWLPPGLEIDLFEGKAWVSVVAFTMEKIRPKNLPAFPPISDFHEINIRTYVTHLGKPGVHFLSIEAGNKISTAVARKLSKLPYRFSHMKRTQHEYTSHNDEFGDRLELNYKIGDVIKEKTNLDLWLTERYALFQHTKKHINSFEIQHVEWPIFSLELDDAKAHYPRFKKLLTSKPDKVHYSPGVQVLARDKVETPLVK